jgi:type IV secretion system protein VirB5
MMFFARVNKTTDTENDTINPYLNARRDWNGQIEGLVSSLRGWQIVGILGLLIALTAVGGLIHLSTQSQFIPYVIEVDKLGQAVAVKPADRAGSTDPRVIHAEIASFITDARLVTPDVVLQRAAIFRVYAKLSSHDPATTKMNQWLNGSPTVSPFARAAKETVSIEIVSIIPQTGETWQVEWIETVTDRQGTTKDRPYRMRALVTVYIVAPTSATTEDLIRKNPLGLYVRDFSWAKQSEG